MDLPSWAHPQVLPGLLEELFRRQGYRTLQTIETPDRAVDLVILRDTLFEHDLRLVRCYWVPSGSPLGRMPLEAFAEGMRRVSEVGGIFLALGVVPDLPRKIATTLAVELWEVAQVEELFRRFGVDLPSGLDLPPLDPPPVPPSPPDPGLGAPPSETAPPFRTPTKPWDRET